MESIDSNIKIFRNKTFASNTYFLCNETDSACIIIDPGLDTEPLLDFTAGLKFKPLAILSTHGHFDHLGSAAELQIQYEIPFYLHKADLKLSQSANFFLHVAGINLKIKTPKPDFLLSEKRQIIQIGNFEIESTNFPGHSNGSCVFRYKNYLFTGDILYKNGLGPESMPKEDKTLLRESILNIFANYSDECLVLPGHGSADSIGNIKMNNTELMKFISNNQENG